MMRRLSFLLMAGSVGLLLALTFAVAAAQTPPPVPTVPGLPGGGTPGTPGGTPGGGTPDAGTPGAGTPAATNTPLPATQTVIAATGTARTATAVVQQTQTSQTQTAQATLTTTTTTNCNVTLRYTENSVGVGGVTIQLTKSGSTTVVASGTTASDGTVTFSNIPPSTYVATAVGKGLSANVTVNSDCSVTVSPFSSGTAVSTPPNSGEGPALTGTGTPPGGGSPLLWLNVGLLGGILALLGISIFAFRRSRAASAKE